MPCAAATPPPPRVESALKLKPSTMHPRAPPQCVSLEMRAGIWRAGSLAIFVFDKGRGAGGKDSLRARANGSSDSVVQPFSQIIE